MFRCLMGGGDEGDLPSRDGQRAEDRGETQGLRFAKRRLGTTRITN